MILKRQHALLLYKRKILNTVHNFEPAAVFHGKHSRIRATDGLMRWKRAHLRLCYICLSCTAAPFQIRSRVHMAESPHCPGLLNLGLHPRISHLCKYTAINARVLTVAYGSKLDGDLTLVCALCFWHTRSETASRECVGSLSAAGTSWKQTSLGFADDSRTFRQGRGHGHMTLACGTSSFVDLWDCPLRTCACLHNLASSDHQENYRIGVSYWDMICNSNYAKNPVGISDLPRRRLFHPGPLLPWWKPSSKRGQKTRLDWKPSTPLVPLANIKKLIYF